MKFWPQKRWKQILLIAFLAVIVAGAVLMQYVKASINKDVVNSIDVINSSGSSNALVVYQPGLMSGPKDAAYTFADGLASNGWRVEVTTASPETSSNLSSYSLLVLAYPIYGAKPGEAEMRYVDRLGDMQQIHAVTIDVRWSNAVESIMKQKIESQNGTVIGTFLAGTTNLRQVASQISPY